jgi:hypothetical protein
MATFVLNNGSRISKLGDNGNGGDSDYGSDFSEGEEQLVDQLLEDLVTGNTAATATSTPRNYNGQPHARPSVAARGSLPSSGVAVSAGIAQGLSSDDEAEGTSPLERSAMLSDSIEYPDCKSSPD